MERTDVKNNHTEEYSTGQIRCIEKSDPEYPQIMKQYSSMPAKLYVKGRLPDPKRRTVAVIGARMCSPYGRMQAFRYTAGFALEQGKMVYAIPGAVTDELSRGCHKLIYDGAGIAYCPEIMLEELGISMEKVTQNGEKNNLGLARDLNMVYSCLDLRPKNPDYIVRKTGFSPAQVSNCLVELTLRGLIRESGRHYYVKDS